MKPKTKAKLLIVLGCIVGACTFIFLWWLSGSEFPNRRGWDAFNYVVLLTLCSAFGGNTIPLLFWNWFYDKFYNNK